MSERAQREDRTIRAVLFDLDGTLYRQLPLRIAMAGEMAVASAGAMFSGGLRIPRVVAAFRKTRERLRSEPGGGSPVATRQYAAVAEALHIPTEDVERIVDEWIYRRPLKWLPYCRRGDVVGLLDWLARRGVRKGVLSDYPAHDKLKALGLAGRFDVVVSTVDLAVNAFKPDPRGYLVAARGLGLDPSEVLYVGDRIDVDGRGAHAAGMPFAVLTRRRVGPDGLGIRQLADLKAILAPR